MSAVQTVSMGSETEVDPGLVADGVKLLERLSDALASPDTAFWLWFRDVEGQRLVLSGGELFRYGAQAARRRVRVAIEEAPALQHLTEDLVGVARPGARSVQVIEGAVSTGPGIHDVRIRNNSVNGVTIRGAYVYRVS